MGVLTVSFSGVAAAEKFPFERLILRNKTLLSNGVRKRLVHSSRLTLAGYSAERSKGRKRSNAASPRSFVKAYNLSAVPNQFQPTAVDLASEDRWDVFVSYASVDGPTVARPLAEKLRAQGLRVWLDQYELLLGDSLRAKIDEGLRKSRFGIVVLSKAFFGRQWPQRELDAMAARESNGQKVILPVWHGVDANDIVGSSPLLADRISVSTNRGLDAVVADILQVVRPGASTGVVRPPATTVAVPPVLRRRAMWYALAGLVLSAAIGGAYWLLADREGSITPGAHRIIFDVWNSLSRTRSNQNEIHLTNEYLAVVIYGDRTFDVSEIDLDSVRAADATTTGGGTPVALYFPADPKKKDLSYDENRDGYPDLKLDFKVSTMRAVDNLSADTTRLRVWGFLPRSGQRFEGLARVTVLN